MGDEYVLNNKCSKRTRPLLDTALMEHELKQRKEELWQKK